MKRVLTIGAIALLIVACFALPCFADEVGDVTYHVYAPTAKYTNAQYFDITYDEWEHTFENEQENTIKFTVERIDVHNATTGEWENTVVNVSIVNLVNPQATLGMHSYTFNDWNSVPSGIQNRENGAVIPFENGQRVDKGDKIWMVYTHTDEYKIATYESVNRSVWLYAKANEYNNDEYYQNILNELNETKEQSKANLYKPLAYLEEAGDVLNIVTDGFPFVLPLAIAGVGVGVISLVLYGDKGI